jgi:pimeloyl-ACP methyl ester carboxylesterase
MKNYGKLTLSFLQQMNMDQPVLVGHSMGGQVALQAAKQAPKHVKQLILLAASGYLKPFSRWLVSLSYVPFFTWYVRKMFAKKDPKEVLYEVVYDRAIIDEEMITSYTDPLLEKAFYRSLIGLLRAHGGDLPETELSTIRIPALLLWGKEDRIVPLEVGQRLVQDLPDASLKVYEHTGHLLPEEKPKEVCRDIQAFLS